MAAMAPQINFGFVADNQHLNYGFTLLEVFRWVHNYKP